MGEARSSHPAISRFLPMLVEPSAGINESRKSSKKGEAAICPRRPILWISSGERPEVLQLAPTRSALPAAGVGVIPKDFGGVPKCFRAAPRYFRVILKDFRMIPKCFRAAPKYFRVIPKDFRVAPNYFRAIPRTSE